MGNEYEELDKTCLFLTLTFLALAIVAGVQGSPFGMLIWILAMGISIIGL